MDDIRIYYYVNHVIPPGGRELIVGIHGAGPTHYGGGQKVRDDFGSVPWYPLGPNPQSSFAEYRHAIIVAPVFDRYYWDPGPEYNYPVNYSYPLTWEERCALYEHYWNVYGGDESLFPDGYPLPVPYLWDFIYLLNSFNLDRTDFALNRIVNQFHIAFPDVDQRRFSLFGYSGGGQFVSRYMTLYPDKLRRVALGGAGTHLFPCFGVNYPQGLRRQYAQSHTVTLPDGTFLTDTHGPIPGVKDSFMGLDQYFNKPMMMGWADWLTGLSEVEIKRRLARLLAMDVWIYAGTEDYVGDVPQPGEPLPGPRLDFYWQGFGQYEKALNYWNELYETYHLLQREIDPGTGKPFVGRNAPFRAHVKGHHGNHPQTLDYMYGDLRDHWLTETEPPDDGLGGFGRNPYYP